MSAAKNGGQAFPRDPATSADGMTLRDFFAAKALQGLLADPPESCRGADWQEDIAGYAYEMADAMLKARAA